jgi:hypothetical protein
LSVPVLVPHDADCPRKGQAHSDAAKRISDTWRLHRSALGLGAAGRWFAAALADGTGDGQLYDSKADAVVHQHHNEQYFAFLCISPADLSVCEAEESLNLFRTVYDNPRLRFTDRDHPAGGPDIIRRLAREDDRSLIRSLASGGRTRPANLIYPRTEGS